MTPGAIVHCPVCDAEVESFGAEFSGVDPDSLGPIRVTKVWAVPCGHEVEGRHTPGGGVVLWKPGDRA